MLNPIEIAYQPGATLYSVIHYKDGTVWNGLAFEAFNSAHWATYAVPLTEQSPSGYYRAAFPAGIGDLLTTEATYNQQGVSPALVDATPGPISIGQSQGVDVAAVVHSEQAAANMYANLALLVPGSVQTGAATTTYCKTNISATLTNVYNGRLIVFTSGVCAGSAGVITAYSVASSVVYFTMLPATPAPGDGFLII